MEKTILAAYSSLTVVSALLSILAFTVLVRCHKPGDYGSTLKMALGLFFMSFFQFIDRAWWTVWKDRYISRDSSAWMLDHAIPMLAPLAMTGGALLVIMALTEDSPHKRVFNLCFGGVLCVFFLSWMKA